MEVGDFLEEPGIQLVRVLIKLGVEGEAPVILIQYLFRHVCIVTEHHILLMLLQQKLFQHRQYQELRLQVMRNKEMAMQE